MADGRVVFKVDGDPSGINSTLKDVTNNIEKESKKWDKAAGESASGAESAWTGAVGKIAGALTAAGIGKVLLSWGKAAISAASDLSEVQNVVDVTFGDGAKKIDAWAKSAGSAFGLTETQAKKFTSTIGAMMKSSGVAGDEIVQMSTDLSGLAADMASFYNLDFETAFDKIRAGISGETMPLKQLGINMSVANLEAFALEQGIKKSYSAMSQGEQTILRYKYLMKATADAQGDFARTSDGYANSMRRVETALETIKTIGGEILLKVVEPIVSGIADILAQITKRPERTVLDDFADIDKDYADKMNRLEAVYNTASDILDVMDNMKDRIVHLADGRTMRLEDLFGDISEVKKAGGDVQEYINSLGLDVNTITAEYDEWNDSLSRLTSSVPQLTSVIDAQTGAIDGGTEAIRTNLEEWKKAEQQKIVLTAYYQKALALQTKQGEIGGYLLDYKAAEIAKNRELENLKRQSWASSLRFTSDGELDYDATYQQLYWDYNGKYPSGSQEMLNRYYGTGKGNKYDNSIRGRYLQAQQEYENQVNAYGTAEQQLADVKQAVIEMYGEEAVAAFEAAQATETAADSTEDALARTEEAAKEVKNAVIDAMTSLVSYMQSVYDSTERAVDGVVSGFKNVERPTTELLEKRSKLIEQQNDLNRSTKEGETQYQQLQEQIDELNKSLNEYSTGGMEDALKSQLAFMDEYIKNLEKAQEMGLSNGLLASLSDGSTQSAEYLAALVADPQAAAEIDAMYQEVQKKKSEFVDDLANQKMAADETFLSLAGDVQDAIYDLDYEDEARDAMHNTMDGLINGILDKKEPLSQAIAEVAQMLDIFSSPEQNWALYNDWHGYSTLLDGEHETGLDYVPFDGYLAGLHEGEGILTAEENRIWQRFKNGAQPQSVDYDSLGATMRDNVKAGGDVYLDGRVVGAVISQQQGNAYRSLQRSGFQG